MCFVLTSFLTGQSWYTRGQSPQMDGLLLDMGKTPLQDARRDSCYTGVSERQLSNKQRSEQHPRAPN